MFGKGQIQPPQPKIIHDIKDLKSASADSVFGVAFYINTTSTFDESTMWNSGNRCPRWAHVPSLAISGAHMPTGQRMAGCSVL